MSRRRGILAAGALIAGLASYGVWQARGTEAHGTLGEVLREDFTIEVEAKGTLEAASYAEIGPPSVRDFWNYNLTWMIPEGSRVKAGDVVARFNASDLEDRLREHTAEHETASRQKEKEQRDLEIQIRQLDLDLVEARGEVEKVSVERSVPEDLVPAIDRAQTILRERLARQRMEFLGEKIAFQKDLVQRKLELLEVKKQRARLKMDYYAQARDKFAVKAPLAGVIIYVPKRDGRRWEIGEGVWMMAKILKVADLSTLQVEASVLEVDAARVAPRQPARITLDAVPGRAIESVVKDVGRIIHERSVQDSTKVFDIILPLDAIDPEVMRPGMTVRVAVETQALPGALTIPVAAVLTTPEGAAVDVMLSGGRIERRPVVLGPRGRNRVVVEDGVGEGERLVLARRSEA